MKNPKFSKFIIVYNDFYNALSPYNKDQISNLDFYTDLPVYYQNNSNDFYIYIGSKRYNYYLLKCKAKYKGTGYRLNLKFSELVITELFNNCVRMEIKYNEEF